MSYGAINFLSDLLTEAVIIGIYSGVVSLYLVLDYSRVAICLGEISILAVEY